MKDLRKDFNYEDEQLQMPEGHLARFETLLNSKKRKPVVDNWLQSVAAVLILCILASSFWFQSETEVEKTTSVVDETIDLKDFSPQLGELEAFFKASINYELATLDYGEYENVAVSYLEELEKIEKDYTLLQQDLKDSGYNETIIEAMVENLQLRLELLQNLKLKLNELKTLHHEKNKSHQL
jgi:hypothetical protein